MKFVVKVFILFMAYHQSACAQHRVLVLPYEDALLLSDFTDDLAEASQTTPFEAKKNLANRFMYCSSKRCS
jgi:hypothetical protein